MAEDILFDQKDWRFSYRAGALLYRGNKILLQRSEGDGSYSLPGGHVGLGEFSRPALARELMEETGAAITVGRLCFTVELMFMWNKPCHQISYYYLAELKDPAALPYDNFKAYDELGRERVGVEFCWVDLKELKHIEIYPVCIRPYLCNLPEQIIHLQENQLEG